MPELVDCDCPEGYTDRWDCLALQLDVPVAEIDGDPEHHGCGCACHSPARAAPPPSP